MIETGLRGRVVVVTGAAAGIGRTTAVRFALEGARVAAWDVQHGGSDLSGELACAAARVRFAEGTVPHASVRVTC